MAKFVVEFSPPVKTNSQINDCKDVENYRMILAPFQKQTQVEFSNIKLKETAVRCLTVVNPLDKSGQFVLPPSSDGIYFDIFEFSLGPNQCRDIMITWNPSQYGNIRKSIKIEQKDCNKKYEFVILGNCIYPPGKTSKTVASNYLKPKLSNISKKIVNYGQANNSVIKNKIIKENSNQIPEVKSNFHTNNTYEEDSLQSQIRRQTFLVGEKENYPVSKKNILGRDTILTSPEHSIKRPDPQRQDHCFNSHFNIQNKSSSPMSDDSLDKPLKIVSTRSPFSDLCFTPLKNTKNIMSPFTTSKCTQNDNDIQQLSFDIQDGASASTSLNSSFGFKPIETSTVAKIYSPEERKPTRVSVNLLNVYDKTAEDEEPASTTYIKDKITQELNLTPPFSSITKINTGSTSYNMSYRSMVTCSGVKPKRPSFAIKNSPYYKCSPKSTAITKTKLKQYSNSPIRASRMKIPNLDKCDQYLKCLANPELVYHNNAEDPFLKMSQYYETEWLNRQESDMIRWLNALLTPTENLVDEDHSGDLEQAAMAWVEASKDSHKNKPMQLATQKDLFVAQIYRQSPQQWSALRKATSNLCTSQRIATVLSKLTISIEKDLITVRDDRQIHLDLSLKKKIIDLLKCYNPLWFRIGLEAIYGQIVPVKVGSTDLDGVGWFIRKNLFNNDYVKKKFTKTTVLQVNLPSFNIAMKKFILRKILMLIYFLDCAKEQHLIRHNPCLFKLDSPYKSSYDFLMAFCADLVTAHGDIVRRLRNIGYILTHKQTHLDEVNYAVKSLNDLRDGTRITKVVEILFKGDPLSQKLRLPAISKLQKIHNVNLAIQRILQHITIEGNISTRDIVNGHREKILSLFWQIIYKYLTPKYNKAAEKIQNWWRNSSLKLVILKRIRAKRIAKRHMAAIIIQSHARGFITRKKWSILRPQLVSNREKLHMASTTIKRYLQKKLKFLTEERKNFIILRRTTIFIQSKFRAYIAMKKAKEFYLKTKLSVIIIQKVFRGFLIRKNWLMIKYNLNQEKQKRTNAINVIKRVLRKNLPFTDERINYQKLTHFTICIQRRFRNNFMMKKQRKQYLILKHTAIVVQQRYRANCAMKQQINQYLTLKHAAIVVQQRYRANCAMKQQRKIYLLLLVNIVQIQSYARGYIFRKQWPVIKEKLEINRQHLAKCSNIIKKALRKNLPLTNEYKYFTKLKKFTIVIQKQYRMKKQLKEYTLLKSSVVIIQKKFRANQAMKLQKQIYIKTKTMTIKLQSLIRGYLVRKNWPETKCNLLVEKTKLVNASNKIKKFLRRSLPSTKERIHYQKLTHFTICIQRRFRTNFMMKKQRNQYLTLKHAAIVVQQRYRANCAMKQQRKIYLLLLVNIVQIQSYARGYIFRKQWPVIKEKLEINRQHLAKCSNIIKKALRKNLPLTNEYKYFTKLKKFTIVIQKQYRMKKQLKEYTLLKSSVVIIQKKFRANQAMKLQKQIYIKTKTMTIKLQSLIRGYLVRKNWPETKCNLLVEKTKLVNASNKIKKFLRRSLPSTKDRIKYLELRKSVMKIQSLYRANVLMKQHEREYLLLKDSVVTVQRHFRAQKAMKIQKSNYSSMIKSIIVLQSLTRGYLVRKQWPEIKITLESYQNNVIEEQEKKNVAAVKIQAAIRGFLVRKNFPQLINKLQIEKLSYAATIIQSAWRGYCIRKKYNCRRETIRFPKRGALTLGRRHHDVEDVLRKQKRNEYSYKELAAVFWTLELCTSLSKELCIKTAEGTIVDYIFHFLQYSNQSQPSIEAREPAIRVLTNLLRYHETSWHIWRKTIRADMIKELIKMMKTSCGKIGASKLYCSIATWLWIAMQDPEKKKIIQNISITAIDFKFMIGVLNRKYKTRKLDKKFMVLPSLKPTWNIGSICQKCFESDLYATTQICKLLNVK
ncbi:protein abnormal spindle isoform X2 [Daktulosphaira vitifoliae]|uniref:protein abnormal spindle isoform X2 n=1 Tax=Daktulosphaira vitifoliae TaxID=58002 RepID=UPI0021AAB673|nr:protein abnormal spindle isoform X2 [Daktulosphaira vitifoliae]